MVHGIRKLKPVYGQSHSTAPPPDVRDEDLEIVGYMLGDCPGCGHMHYFSTEPWMRGVEPGPIWAFNSDVECPTFSPSIIQQGDYWNDDKQVFVPYTCHFFLKDGEFDFLGDCTHAKRGRKFRVAWEA